MVRVLAHGRRLIESLRLRVGYGKGRIDGVVAEHRARLLAIRERDFGAVSQFPRRHRLAACDDVLNVLERTPK